jgi:hypothetical protein
MFIFPYEKLDLIGTMEALHFNVSVCWWRRYWPLE